jgi:hypothetical protein
MDHGHSPFVEKLCSLTDPFCDAAVGSKLPDSNTTRTLSLTCTGFVTITSNAAGTAAIAFSNDPAVGYQTSATYTSNVVNTWTTGTAYSGFSGIPNTAIWRLVSGGINITPVMSVTTNSGSLGILAVPPYTSTVQAAAVDLDSLSYLGNVRNPSSSPAGVTGVVDSDGTTSAEFRGQGTVTSTQLNSSGSSVLVAYIVGGPASAASYTVRYTYHYELAFPFTTVFNNLSTPAAPKDEKVMDGVSKVKSVTNQIVAGGVREFERSVQQAASNFGKNIFRFGAYALGAYLGGPAGGAAGYSSAHAITAD